MSRVLISPIVLVALTFGLHAQAPPPDDAELTGLLNEFLAGASRNDAATHERFWAEDLIYTGSSGRRIGKADILRDVRSEPPPEPGDPITRYTAEEIRIQRYGDTAVVAFRLVATTEQTGKTGITNYLNTGTFLKRNDRWQVVAWQATRMAQPEEEARKEVAAAQAAFHQAVLAADVGTLEVLLDESFIWTHPTGDRTTRQQLLDQLESGELRYSKLETSDVTVSVHGDTGIVRGVSPVQRTAFPGSGGSGDAGPFAALYTLTLARKDGAWKAVALHTSRP